MESVKVYSRIENKTGRRKKKDQAQNNNELRQNALWVWTGEWYGFFVIVTVKIS